MSTERGDTKARGARGEALALRYLLQRGYRLVAQNYRVGHKELDLIVQDGDVTVFAEVKARSGASFGTPGEAVTARKRQNLLVAANAYLARNGLFDAPARFDVLEVDLVTGKVRHIVDAFGQ